MNLPKSVLSLIVSHLDPGENVRTSSTLASLCLVSKEIRSIATPVLWHKIRIDVMRHSPDRGMVELFYQLGVLDGTGKKMKDGTTKEQLGWMKTLGRKCDYDVQKKAWERSRARGRSSQDDEFYPDEENYDMDYDDYGSDDEGYGYGSNRGGDKLDPFKWSANEILDPFSYRQILALEAFPHLRPYVKLVDFHGRLEGVIPSKVIERILKICPNVETVLLQRAQVRDLLEEGLLVSETLVNHAKNLTRLEIIDFPDDGSTQSLLSNLAKLPKLLHLSLTCKSRYGSDWHLTNHTSHLPAPLPQKFKSLHIGSTLGEDGFLPIFTSSSNKFLTSLGVTVRRVTPDLSAYKNVQHLTITFDKIDRATETLRTLPLETKISTLELRWSDRVAEAEYREHKYEVGSEDEFEGYDESGSEGEEEVKPVKETKPVPHQKPIDPLILLLQAIPSTVHTLSFPYSLYSSGDNVEKDFEKAFESDSVPSNLRNVCLVGAPDKWLSKEDEEEMVKDDYVDYEEEDRKEQEGWLNQIGQVLKKKGIDLIRVADWSEALTQRSFMARLSSGKMKPT